MNRFAPDEYYAVEGRAMNQLRDVMLRLYTEERMTADDMRDAAHAIRHALEHGHELGALDLAALARAERGHQTP